MRRGRKEQEGLARFGESSTKGEERKGKKDAKTYQNHHIGTSVPNLLSQSLERSVIQISIESVRSASSEDRDGLSVELSSPLVLDEFGSFRCRGTCWRRLDISDTKWEI